MTARYAERTKVPVQQSQNQIHEGLKKAGADQTLVFEGDAKTSVGSRLAHLEFLLALMAACAAKSVRSQEHTEYWYGCRLERLKDLGKEHGIWDEMAAIIANGDNTRVLPDGTWHHEPPTYAQQLNRATYRAQAAEALSTSYRKASEAWDWLAEHINLELSWGDHPDAAEGDPCVWQVHRVTGSRSDREWDLIGFGETPLHAVEIARQALSQERKV